MPQASFSPSHDFELCEHDFERSEHDFEIDRSSFRFVYGPFRFGKKKEIFRAHFGQLNLSTKWDRFILENFENLDVNGDFINRRERTFSRTSADFEKLFSRTSADFEISKLEIEGFWEFQVPFLGHENGHFYVRLRTVSYLDGNGHFYVRLRPEFRELRLIFGPKVSRTYGFLGT